MSQSFLIHEIMSNFVVVNKCKRRKHVMYLPRYIKTWINVILMSFNLIKREYNFLELLKQKHF